MGKFERIMKRREQREQQRDVERGMEEQKERKKQEHKMATWRKDQQGNIIFGGWLRISKMAIAGLIAIILIGTFFAVAIITNDETAGECANPFCQFLGMDKASQLPEQFAPPTSGTTEERELP